ncbi:hypothetical protein [Nonomuraea sp. NPDC049158]|uniref:hypothetical protein n=1 Tax=Nonomuraea sp. NPDC049158 TaxID=3155649 RepID=UPI0033D41A4A
MAGLALAVCGAGMGATMVLGGWLATTYDLRTPLYAAAGLLLAVTAVTATMTVDRPRPGAGPKAIAAHPRLPS